MTTTAHNSLEQLKQLTKVVADTGDFGLIKQYEPLDATTNPSLIFKALQKEEYATLLDQAVEELKGHSSSSAERLGLIIDRVLILFGLEILKLIPGRVSTEVDARLSFDSDATIQRARKLIADYAVEGIDRDRILIKIASTWEGIKAAEVLQQEGIHCNMTLLSHCPRPWAAQKRMPNSFLLLWVESWIGIKPRPEKRIPVKTIQEFSRSKKSILIIKSSATELRLWEPLLETWMRFLSSPVATCSQSAPDCWVNYRSLKRRLRGSSIRILRVTLILRSWTWTKALFAFS